MAKKKQNDGGLSYLQMPLPQSGKAYKMTKINWSGLNRRQEIDTGMLSEELNISTEHTPYLTPSMRHTALVKVSQYSNAAALYGFDDFLCVIYIKNNAVWIDYIKDEGATIYTGMVSRDVDDSDDNDGVDTVEYDENTFRSMVQFNVYDTPTDPIGGSYRRRLLIYPDRAAMPMYIETARFTAEKYTDSDADKTYYYAGKDSVEPREYGTLIYNTKDGKWYEYIDVETDKSTNHYGEYKFRLNSDKTYFKCDGMDAVVRTYNKAKDDSIIEGAQESDDDYDEKLEKWTLSSMPDSTANTGYYYYNAATRETWRYVEVELENGGTKWDWRVSTAPNVPKLKYATVHLSRVFGVDDSRVYASGFNDYCNWTLDTIKSYNESNSWVSASQANAKADGIFTGLISYQGNVVCFKRDYMQEIYNTKNPFRINEIFAEGAIDFRTIQEVDGRLIFVSNDNVKIYTGSNPRILGYYLNIGEYKYAVAGTDNRNYFLYCEDEDGKKYYFTYDTVAEQWSRQGIGQRIKCFAHNKTGMYYLGGDGKVYRTDTNDFEQDFEFETDLITRQDNNEISANIKHIKKLQMMTDIADGAEFKVYFLYDDEKFDERKSHLVYSSGGKSGRVAVRVKPRQTAHWGIKMHVCGHGDVTMYGLELWFEAGGDLYV